MGLITVLIRFMGGLAEGVMYAILLGNALSPLIDKFTQPRTYGAREEGRRYDSGAYHTPTRFSHDPHASASCRCCAAC